MKKIILSISLLFPFTSHAAGDYCHMVSDTPEKIVNIKHSPQWFAKVKNTGDYIFYIGHSGNRLLSTTDTNETTRDNSIYGSYDPVPSPDGRILTVPGMIFYLTDDIIRLKDRAVAFETDRELGGVYQSVALLKIVEPDVRHYRVITDGRGSQVQYRDYEVDFRVSPPKLKKLGPVTQHCPGKELSTIMVSKTGRYVTAYNMATSSTKIFDMVEMADGHPNRCRELMDMGYGTGKIEFNVGAPRNGEIFNFEDSDERIAFHLDYFGTNIGEYFSTVSGNQVKDIFTMDLEPVPANRSGAWKFKPTNLRKLFSESRLGSGGYYPSFFGDGKVAVVFDDANSFSFRFYDSEKSKPYEFFLPPRGTDFNEIWRDTSLMPQNWQPRFHRAAAIGALWSQVCLPAPGQRTDTTAVGSTSYFLGLTKATCADLVNAKWDAMRGQLINHPMWRQDPRFSAQMIEQLTANDLLQACLKIQDHAPANPPIIIGQGSAIHLTKDKLIHNYCMGCHVPDSRLPTMMGEEYPNTVNFDREPDGFPRTNLTHLLSSKRRVQTGIDHAQNGGGGPRPPDSMPPGHPFEDPAGTEFDHGGEIQAQLEKDIKSVVAMPKRVPLYLRGDIQAVASMESSGEQEVHFTESGNRIQHYSMPPTNVGQETRKIFELVNNSADEMTELGAQTLQTQAFFFPGGLFPGTNGDCGASLRAHSKCKIEVGFSPSVARQLTNANLTISYVAVQGTRRQEKQVTLPLDGIAPRLASR